jgi:hypothetical protein
MDTSNFDSRPIPAIVGYRINPLQREAHINNELAYLQAGSYTSKTTHYVYITKISNVYGVGGGAPVDMGTKRIKTKISWGELWGFFN